MDDSWRRVQIGSKLPRRRSTEETSSYTKRNYFGFNLPEAETLDPDEFNDVFGGPPRSVLLRQFSGDFSDERLASFYDEIFRITESEIPARNGRNLPGFRIPATRGGLQGFGGFYNDIFGFDDDRRSRSRSKSKSKSNSSSVLSSEALSPLRPSVAEDVGFSAFASKLRPINVPCRQNPPPPPFAVDQQKRKSTPAPPCIRPPHMDFHLPEDTSKENFEFSYRFTSPETISIDPNSYGSIKVSVDDPDLNSPSSIISSMYHEPDPRAGVSVKSFREEDIGEVYEEEEEEEEEDLNSYVIEIACDRREEPEEAVAVDEAIAWAKEKFQARNFKKSEGGIQQHDFMEMYKERENRREPFIEIAEGNVVPDYVAQLRRGYGSPQSLMVKASQELERWIANKESRHSEKDMAMEVLDEEIQRWSAGKEGNIRSLLATLQNILWPKSGWQALPLAGMIEPSHVRKAYQKARLCIHPDKMQQKGATIPQKYVAEKVFAILQDAWSIFNSQNAFSG